MENQKQNYMSPENQNTIRNKLFELQKKDYKNIKELASIIGVSTNTIGHFNNGIDVTMKCLLQIERYVNGKEK